MILRAARMQTNGSRLCDQSQPSLTTAPRGAQLVGLLGRVREAAEATTFEDQWITRAKVATSWNRRMTMALFRASTSP